MFCPWKEPQDVDVFAKSQSQHETAGFFLVPSQSYKVLTSWLNHSLSIKQVAAVLSLHKTARCRNLGQLRSQHERAAANTA